MNIADLKGLGLSGEAIFVLLFTIITIQLLKLILDYVSKQKKEGGATHDDIMKLCYTILEKLERK